MQWVEARQIAISGLFAPDIPNRPMLFAALEGRHSGIAYVDAVINPTWAIVSTPSSRMFIAGTPPLDCVRDVITQTNKGLIIWEGAQAYAGCISDGVPKPRLEFFGRPTFESLLNGIPDGCSIRRIDRSLLGRSLQRKAYIRYCGSEEGFLRNGIGYALMRGDEILSEGDASSIGGGAAEIGVMTASIHRRKGYASIVTAHVIKECDRLGLSTVWSCDKYNVGSVGVAKRLGYPASREYTDLRNPLWKL